MASVTQSIRDALEGGSPEKILMNRGYENTDDGKWSKSDAHGTVEFASAKEAKEYDDKNNKLKKKLAKP